MWSSVKWFLPFLGMALALDGCAQSASRKEGKVLFERYNCVSCHGKSGILPYDLTRRIDSLSDDRIKQFIINPAAFGNRLMPSFGSLLNEEELQLLVDYVRELSLREKRKKK